MDALPCAEDVSEGMGDILEFIHWTAERHRICGQKLWPWTDAATPR
jgi:hypothetical protein